MASTRSERPDTYVDVERSASPSVAATDGAATGGAATDDGSATGMRGALETLVRLIERVAPGMRGSILLLDDDGVTLRHGAAPSLPMAYCRLIDGERIGPAAGSCGTAAYRGERVIVRDIATDPLWATYREAAEPFGLAACWSTPIVDAEGRLLGTFAMYYGEPREPTPDDITLTETATLLAANIISRARATAALRAREEELRSSAERLRAALEASSTSTWRWSVHSNVVECDEGMFRLHGIDPTSAPGSFALFMARIHADDRERVAAAARRCTTEGGDLDEEFRIVRPDGTVRWAVAKGRLVRGGDGRPQYLIGASVDVTERRVRDNQFRALAESIPQLAWMADAAGARHWHNQRWFDYTGATPEEAQGWGWRSFHHPEHVERVVAGIRRAWSAGVPWEDTFPLRGRDGAYRWFLSRAQPIRDADGNVVRWFGTSTDITELREAELARDRALAEAKTERERLHEVFMQAPAAIAVFEGPEHRFVVANPRYRELAGHRDVVGQALLDVLPEIRGQGFVELLDSVYASGEPYSAHERVVQFDRDGDGVPEDFYLDFVYQPLKNGRGQTFGIMAHAVEVTAQVHAREALAAARTEAERANRAKSEFLAAMSHDLRTPLNAISGFADLVANGVYGPVNADQHHAMVRIQRAGNHLLALINDILNFAKIEAGRIDFHVEDLAVNELLVTVGAMLELQAARKGLAFRPRLGAEGVRVRADRERTIQVLANLLTNAVKCTETGTVDIGWHADEHTVRLEVRDTGHGIAADRLTAIFEPFVQLGRGTEAAQQGVGLGLAISRELARAMGGDLGVESVVGQGSTFTLVLPRGADA